MERKRVYTFGNGKAEGKADMRNLLGGKGANLAEMNLIGVPVPPGFTITTEVCSEYYDLGKDKVVELLKSDVEKAIANIAETGFEPVTFRNRTRRASRLLYSANQDGRTCTLDTLIKYQLLCLLSYALIIGDRSA